ncbi:hypothetical protein FRC09_006760 [Ceratobasidium sp. 395]|nr:hypothetical protein FRC09_006760 [Ceratobasidium sp. 395]
MQRPRYRPYKPYRLAEDPPLLSSLDLSYSPICPPGITRVSQLMRTRSNSPVDGEPPHKRVASFLGVLPWGDPYPSTLGPGQVYIDPSNAQGNNQHTPTSAIPSLPPATGGRGKPIDITNISSSGKLTPVALEEGSADNTIAHANVESSLPASQCGRPIDIISISSSGNVTPIPLEEELAAATAAHTDTEPLPISFQFSNTTHVSETPSLSETMGDPVDHAYIWLLQSVHQEAEQRLEAMGSQVAASPERIFDFFHTIGERFRDNFEEAFGQAVECDNNLAADRFVTARAYIAQGFASAGQLIDKEATRGLGLTANPHAADYSRHSIPIPTQYAECDPHPVLEPLSEHHSSQLNLGAFQQNQDSASIRDMLGEVLQAVTNLGTSVKAINTRVDALERGSSASRAVPPPTPPLVRPSPTPCGVPVPPKLDSYTVRTKEGGQQQTQRLLDSPTKPKGTAIAVAIKNKRSVRTPDTAQLQSAARPDRFGADNKSTS